jgi:hypothetical protein
MSFYFFSDPDPQDCPEQIKNSCFILGIEAIQEEVLAALKHKTPSVKLETAAYLARCFARCPPLLTTNKKASTILSSLF